MHSYEAENGDILNELNDGWWCESVTRGGVATTRRGNNALLHTHVNRESNVPGPLGILRLSLSAHNLIFSPHKLSRLFHVRELRRYFAFDRFSVSNNTVGRTSSWTRERQFGHRYLCHFSTEMAEIWCPGTSFQDV